MRALGSGGSAHTSIAEESPGSGSCVQNEREREVAERVHTAEQEQADSEYIETQAGGHDANQDLQRSRALP